jgi:aryl-alcohol dehydrogenase-like predicted oxidoreductase
MLPTAPFGRTGHPSTRLVFGAAALWNASQDDADRALETLLEFGVNHIDTAASYGDAELRIGPWMREHRKRFFLATKTGERAYAAARDQIRRSLERLRVDHVDLLQLHNLVDEGEWQRALGDDGALHAAVEAREEGLVRWIGVTGHGTRVAAMHRRSLERFDFASVLLPYNHVAMQDPAYARDFEALLTECRQRGVAVQTIKSVARRRWPEGTAPRRTTWYEPLEDAAAIEHAVHFSLGLPGSFVATAGDLGLLRSILEAGTRFAAPPSDSELREDEARLGVAPLFVRGYSATV